MWSTSSSPSFMEHPTPLGPTRWYVTRGRAKCPPHRALFRSPHVGCCHGVALSAPPSGSVHRRTHRRTQNPKFILFGCSALLLLFFFFFFCFIWCRTPILLAEHGEGPPRGPVTFRTSANNCLSTQIEFILFAVLHLLLYSTFGST